MTARGGVGIPDPERWALSYPRELSGGRRQRVMIALAMASRPRLLLADDPTTALDVTTQAQILALLWHRLRAEQGMAVVFVAHQLAVIAEICDRVAVMSQGRLVEIGDTATVFGAPRDEHTKALPAAHPHARPAGAAGLPRAL